MSASVSDAQGVADEPQVLESDASSPSEMYICASTKNSLRERRVMYDASFVISIPYSRHTIPPSPPSSVLVTIESARESDCSVDTSLHTMKISGAFQAAFDANVSDVNERVSVFKEDDGI